MKKLAENPADMGQRRYLSGYDIIGANTLYQCTQHLGGWSRDTLFEIIPGNLAARVREDLIGGIS